MAPTCSRFNDYFILPCASYKNIAIVPQTAIDNARDIIIPSNKPHLLAIDTFAAIGPMIHSKNADEHPRKARISLKPGTSIDITTDSNAILIRWRMRKTRFTVDAFPVASFKDGGRGTAIPSTISNVVVSG
jgi:hypothetical protein